MEKNVLIGNNDLGNSELDWLHARDTILRNLRQGNSVNLVAKTGAKWRELIDHIKKDFLPDLGLVDLDDNATITRQGLIAEMLKACGSQTPVPIEPEDLIALATYFEQRTTPARVALTHFDMIVHRPTYEINLFAALRYLMTEKRKLALLIHSRAHFVELLPANHLLSTISNLITVEL